MLKDITLGQYFPGNSFVHRLDPRTKLLLMSAYIVAVFIVGNMWLFTLVAAYVIGVTAIAGVPVSYLWRSLKPLRFILIFMFAINLLVTATGDTLFEWWIIKITTGAKMGFPAHELAMMMTIALRFIPTLIEEADKITKAQTARGADFEAGSLIDRAKAMVTILVPLFVSAFRRADELAMAMESRCYHGGEGRTRMTVLKYTKNDLKAALSMALLIGMIIAVQAVT